ncbi:MAG: hypothetical protein ACR2LQ_14490 [Acidimicrobiales bacterium]
MDHEPRHGHIALLEAATLLRLPVQGVEALVGAGYLRPAVHEPDGPRFALGDLKGLLARLADQGEVIESAIELESGPVDLDPQVLLDALEARSEDMARRALDVLAAVFPEAGRWPLTQQAHFITEARSRFEAIIAVASLGREVDREVIDELAAVGSDAAGDGTALPDVLLVLRISRDLLVQTAVEVAEERGRRWGLALSLVLTRILPSLDRLVDAIASGYWRSMTDQAGLDRSPHVVELAAVVRAALDHIDGGDRVEVAVPPGLRVVADPRLLERLVAELVADQLLGQDLVEIDARTSADGVVLSVGGRGDAFAGDMVVGVASGPLSPGLAVVRELIEALGGEMRYESLSSGGAMVIVTLSSAVR